MKLREHLNYLKRDLPSRRHTVLKLSKVNTKEFSRYPKGGKKRWPTKEPHQAASGTLQAKGVAWPPQNTEREGLSPKSRSRKVIIQIGRRSKCFPRHTKAEGARPALGPALQEMLKGTLPFEAKKGTAHTYVSKRVTGRVRDCNSISEWVF